MIYDMKEFLGEGLNSVVYRAIRSDKGRRLHQTVALKILKSENSVDLWAKEFASLERVASRHCVRIYGFDWVQGRPALVLEYVSGVSLRQLGLSGPVPKPLAREILAQVQRGLLDLAEHDVHHGDLSPNNIMIDGAGCVKLLDFGWANVALATPEFTAPELLSGAKPDFLSDLYSLGAIERLLLEETTARLSVDRTIRPTIEWPPDSGHQAELAARVREIIAHQSRFANIATRSLQLARRSRPRAMTWAVAGVLLFAAPKPECLASSPAFIKVRSLKWSHVFIDGIDAGYAPQDLAVSTDRPHRIELRAAEGRAAVTVRLQPGEIRMVNDVNSM